MGKQRIADRAVSALQALVNLTPAQVTQGSNYSRLGYLPIGVYKGSPAFVDLDKLANQPLVQAEMLHILGLLDGREEDYDLQTLTIANGTSAGAAVRGQLTVPGGEVWFVNAVEMVLPADAGGTPTMNWQCSLWTDRVGESVYGQPFHANALDFSPGGGTQWDEFTYPGNFWAATNKPQLLRLPAGTVITFTAINTIAAATADMVCVGRLYGFIGKPLVA